MMIYSLKIEVSRLTKNVIRGPSLKRWVTVIAPAIISLINGIGILFHIDTSIATGLIALLTTFAGTLIGISRRKRKRKVGKHDSKTFYS